MISVAFYLLPLSFKWQNDLYHNRLDYGQQTHI